MSEYISITEKLPRDSQIISIQYTKNGEERRTKGFFFMNGTKLTF